MQNAAPVGAAPELKSGGIDNPADITSAVHSQIYQITLRTPAEGNGVQFVRAALKVLLRRFDLRCLRIEQLPAKGGGR